MSINLLSPKKEISTLKKLQLWRQTEQAIRLPSELIEIVEDAIFGNYDTIIQQNYLQSISLLEHKDLEQYLDEDDLVDDFNEINIIDHMRDNPLEWDSNLLVFAYVNEKLFKGYVSSLIKIYDYMINTSDLIIEQKERLNNMIKFMIFNYNYLEKILLEIANSLYEIYKIDDEGFDKREILEEIYYNIHNIYNTKNISEYHRRIRIGDELYGIMYVSDESKDRYDKGYRYNSYTHRVSAPKPIDINFNQEIIITGENKKGEKGLIITSEIYEKGDNVSDDEWKKYEDSLRAIDIINRYVIEEAKQYD